MIKKFFLVFICVCILSCSLFVASSAAGSHYTEYYQYNGQAISTSVAEVLSGYALNAIRTSPDLYRYWFAFRLDTYKYAIVLFSDIDSYSFDKSTYMCYVSDGCVMFYDQRLFSYQNSNQTYYQAGLSPNTDFNAPFTFQATRGYLIGNIDATIAVHPEYEDVLYYDYVVYILYTLIAFLLLFVAFKFMNKRWLLP